MTPYCLGLVQDFHAIFDYIRVFIRTIVLCDIIINQRLYSKIICRCYNVFVAVVYCEIYELGYFLRAKAAIAFSVS